MRVSMAVHGHSSGIESHERTRWAGGAGFVAGGVVVAVAAFAAAILLGRSDSEGLGRVYFAYLLNFAYFVSLSLGALFFVLIQHTTRAGWSVAVRRVAEVHATAILFLLPGLLPIFATLLSGDGSLYRWARTMEQAADHGLPGGHAATRFDGGTEALLVNNPPSARKAEPHGVTNPTYGGRTALPAGGVDSHTEDLYIAKKRAYLNAPFFIARCLFYFAVWGGLAWWLWRRSTEQDTSGDVNLTLRMQNTAPGAVVVFGLTLTFAAFDLLMSLSPAWYSTIFGGYFFAGSFVGSLSLLILVLMGLQRSGYLTGSVTTEHYHDLGKFLFGFVFFWGYIAFSQYMLIWYAGLPETVYWFAVRGATAVPEHFNSWTYVILALLFGHFVLPFVGLISRHVKRSRVGLGFWAVWLLVFHWIDLWWITLPEHGPQAQFGLPEVLTFLAAGGLFFAGCAWAASQHALVPLRDPRLADSLAFQNV